MDNTDSQIKYAVSNLMLAANARQSKIANEFLQQFPELNLTAFWYKGQAYQTDNGKPCVIPTKYSQAFPQLPVHASHGFQEILNKQKILDNDYKAICQLMSVLLEPCKSQQDIRDALPDMLLSESMLTLPRTREAGYTATDYVQKLQYEKYHRKMCWYAAQKLIY